MNLRSGIAQGLTGLVLTGQALGFAPSAEATEKPKQQPTTNNVRARDNVGETFAAAKVDGIGEDKKALLSPQSVLDKLVEKKFVDTNDTEAKKLLMSRLTDLEIEYGQKGLGVVVERLEWLRDKSGLTHQKGLEESLNYYLYSDPLSYSMKGLKLAIEAESKFKRDDQLQDLTPWFRGQVSKYIRHHYSPPTKANIDNENKVVSSKM